VLIEQPLHLWLLGELRKEVIFCECDASHRDRRRRLLRRRWPTAGTPSAPQL